MSGLRYLRVATDQQGVSHFEALTLPLSPIDFAPPAPPVPVSEPTGASGVQFLTLPPGWDGGWHPPPRRQMVLLLRGRVGIELSDGTKRESEPGDIVLLENTWGSGHRSWTIGDEDAVLAIVTLAD